MSDEKIKIRLENEAQQKIWEKERRQKEEEERRIAEEHKRVDRLINDAKNWNNSQVLRNFLNAIRKTIKSKHGKIEPGSDLEKWIIWAEEEANRLDPLCKPYPPDLDEREQ